MAELHFTGQMQGYFFENVSGWLDALETARLDLEDGRADTTASIRRIAHAIRGSAGSFGYPEVSRKAADVENASDDQFARELSVLIDLLRSLTDSEQSRKIRILIVEPDSDTSDLLAVMLSSPNRDVITVRSADEARKNLEQQGASLIILALGLPDLDGRELLARLREQTLTSVTPIFVLSDESDPQIETECIALGADAFFGRPFDTTALSSAVSVRLQRRAAVTSRDPETGLPDHVALNGAFERIVSTYDISRSPLCLGVLQLDDFDAVNEIYGYTASEEIRRGASELLLRSLQDSDLLARWRNELFVALFPDTTLEEASQRIDSSIQTVGHASFATAQGSSLRVTTSAGLIRVQPDDSRDISGLVADAAELLSRAQQKGGRRLMLPRQSEEHPQQNILLVEDDELIGKIVKDRLEREGYRVDYHTNGEEALESAQGSTVGLVLLDVKVPGMDGFELLKRLRKMPAFARRPIMMLTAMSSEEDIVRGFDLGADDYILKPFSPRELVARVKRLLSRNGHSV